MRMREFGGSRFDYAGTASSAKIWSLLQRLELKQRYIFHKTPCLYQGFLALYPARRLSTGVAARMASSGVLHTSTSVETLGSLTVRILPALEDNYMY